MVSLQIALKFSADGFTSGVMLKCGVHKCPRNCHYRSDHTQMDCDKIVNIKCSKGHIQKRKCYETKPPKCKKCEIEDRRDEKNLERDMELQDKRLRAQVKHDMDIADLDMQIRKIREEAEDERTKQERARALKQKKRDLVAAQSQAVQASQKAPPAAMSLPTRPPPTTNASADDSNGRDTRERGPKSPKALATSMPSSSKPTSLETSVSELEWERQKRVEGASNAAIDDLMALTGLEDVKAKFLDIKVSLETKARQGIDMKTRMGMVMLGNPGTGMSPN